MKKIILILVVIVASKVFAQKYTPFPTENAEWNVLFTEVLYLFAPPPNDVMIRYYNLHYYLNGDTIINSEKYIKVYEASEKEPSGYFRENNQRIFYRGSLGRREAFFDEEDIILYDFTKQVGDTVDWLQYGRKYIIDSIDSVKVDSQFRKRFIIKNSKEYDSDVDYIIEGIGSVKNGLLGRLSMDEFVTDVDYFWEFVCFSQNGETVYKNPNYISCNPPLAYESISFAPKNTSWYYDLEIHSYHNEIIEYDYLKLESVNETVVNGKFCKEISTTYSKSVCLNNKGFVYENKDTVFMAVGTQFTPIYCWAAQPGDSWDINFSSANNNVRVTVDSVGVISILGKNIREQYVTYSLLGNPDIKINSKIIQGVGDVNHFFHFFHHFESTCDEPIVNRGLRCFIHPTQGSYKTGAIECDYRTGVEDIETINISVYQSDQNNVVVKCNDERIKSVFVFNIHGQKVKIMNDLLSNSINISNLENGVYAIQIRTQQGRIANVKIVIK